MKDIIQSKSTDSPLASGALVHPQAVAVSVLDGLTAGRLTWDEARRIGAGLDRRLAGLRIVSAGPWWNFALEELGA
jgi:hypothetical protein